MILEPALYPNHEPKLSDFRPSELLGKPLEGHGLRGRVAELMEFARENAPSVDGLRCPIRLEIAAELPEPHESSPGIIATVYLNPPSACEFYAPWRDY
jgi:hypothetical protein